MFEVGFSELLLISVIALVVLGPERLPKLVGQVGRWVGKARGMARQFREQLESEVNLDELNRATAKGTSSPSYPPPGEAPPNEPTQPVDQAQADSLATAHLDPQQSGTQQSDTQHNDTVDYPYAASSHSHPEGDVYGGMPAPEPERILSEDPPATPAAAPVEPTAAPVTRLHDERV
jgi:sec-independent protein translocase protein TatB